MLNLRLTLLAVALIGCSPAPPTIAPSTPIPTATPLTIATPVDEEVIYTMLIEAMSDSRVAVLVSGTTNLPDGALITLSASRAFRLRSDPAVRASNVGPWQEVPVSGGRFAGTLALDESILAVGAGDELHVDTLDPDLAACAEFRTGNDVHDRPRQPDTVAAIVGPNGEALATSPQLSIFGDFVDPPSSWLYAQVDLPLEPLIVEQLTRQQGGAPEVKTLDGFCVPWPTRLDEFRQQPASTRP